MSQPTISAEQYSKALAAAERDGVQVMGVANGVAEVFSAHSIKAYEVRIGREQMTCNCQARGYCKHRAAVRQYLIAERVTREAWIAAATLPTPPAAPVRRGPLVDSTPAERAAKFSIFK